VSDNTATRPLDALLEYVKQERGFDFSGYKRSTLERRIAKRMDETGVSDHNEYLDYLTVHPDEFAYLFNTILINVTSFFRDAPEWDFLAEEILPRLLDGKAGDEGIRVWCAGCATGEETLTLTMLLAEAMGTDHFLGRVKLYATDVDDEALAVARMATYPMKALEPVPEHLRAKYFERHDQRFTFRKELRRPVIFGRNDLVQDAPISRVDLLLCRNTLMYFTGEAQQRILRRFNFALNADGFLFLGKSEMLITHSDLFIPLNLRRRVFTKVVRPSLRDRLPGAAEPGGDGHGDGHLPANDAARFIRDSALDAQPVAQIVIDRQGTLVSANLRARALLNIAISDLGRPLRDLEASYRPVELRAPLDDLFADGKARTLAPVQVSEAMGVRRTLEVHL
jgi:two-component system, chemotaxis family, CheB/CheR fusion protein